MLDITSFTNHKRKTQMPKKVPSEEEIITSLKNGQTEEVLSYLEQKQFDLNQIFSTEHYPLYYVVANACNENLLQNLLARTDLTLDLQDAIGMTPLMWAATFGNRIALHLLIGRGADPEKKNSQEEKALDLIVSSRALLRAEAEQLFTSRRSSYPLLKVSSQDTSDTKNQINLAINKNQKKMCIAGFFFNRAKNFIEYLSASTIPLAQKKENQALFRKKYQ